MLFLERSSRHAVSYIAQDAQTPIQAKSMLQIVGWENSCSSMCDTLLEAANNSSGRSAMIYCTTYPTTDQAHTTLAPYSWESKLCGIEIKIAVSSACNDTFVRKAIRKGVKRYGEKTRLICLIYH